MEIIIFTIIGGLLYLLSDWIVIRIELRRGKRLENRTLVFFAIILILALLSFKALDVIRGSA